MKRILLICLAMLWLVPGAAMAHSTLESAVPAQDATINASPERIELTFNTKIEKLSNFKLLNAAGKELDTEKAIVDGATMSGAVPATLANGDYTVKWTIIGADGHSVEGNYSFTVDAPVETAEPSPESESTAETTEDPAAGTPEATAGEEDTTNLNRENALAPVDGKAVNYMPAIIIGGIIAIAALVLFLRRRK
ncbi:copper resistance protein CopC [Paenibacillus alkaliterrae]|uniref:copper resistance CopC family protein n=1 Tax=Paenibacillus alkaliterrae TaxID=320909 RepID=UPI001F33ED8C|nr:copper resistance protein CopC [Paenibacillus alkaliterrae]MCF2937255.1 copper resistance protein CopC [Paenibacillus alkaliterrae]